MIAAAASFLALIKQHRKLATVVLCAGVAAAFYVQWQTAALKASRAQLNTADLQTRAETICEAVRMPFVPQSVKRADWGVACLAEARRLGAIERDLAEGSAEALLAGLDERMGKENADAALAAAMSKRTALAVENMEAADAAVENDRVGPGWAAAVNDLGGLR